MHPRPQPGELLSSWMVRLAHANRYKVHDFYAHYFGRHRSIWNRDIDQLAPDWLLSGLSRHTGVSINAIEQMGLNVFEGKLFNSLLKIGRTRGVLSLGIYHRLRRHYGQQFCPECFKEGSTPFFKTSWRVATVVICDIHHIQLQDRCPCCFMPITPHRLDFQSKTTLNPIVGLQYCSFCLKNITSGENTMANLAVIKFQKIIFEALSKQLITIENETIQSIDFFDGIRVILHGLGRHYKNHLNIDKINMETSDRHIRYFLMEKCSEFIDCWPNKFIDFLSSIPRPYSLFVSKNIDAHAPEWVKKVIPRSFCLKNHLKRQ